MTKVKQGYLKKYGKSVFVSWHKVFMELDSDGILSWHKHKNKKKSKGVNLRDIAEYFTIGSYCRAMPHSPDLPANARLDNMLAFPEKPDKKSKIHFFLCESDHEFSQWIRAIVAFFPTASVVSTNTAPQAALSYSPYSPSPQTLFPVSNHPPMQQTSNQYPLNPPLNNYPPTYPSTIKPTGLPGIGFENLNISGPPQSSHPSQYPTTYSIQPPCHYQVPSTYPPTQPTPQPQTQIPPQQPSHYQQQQHSYYPQQTYSSHPHHPQTFLPQQPTYPYYLPNPSPQNIIIKENSSSGYGKVAAGVLGGAVAGYAASRLFGGGWGGGGWGNGGWGGGGWGCGGMGHRWGSWGSWSSYSWGSSCSWSS